MLGNWIRQTTTTTGTGNLALATVTGYAAFTDYFAAAERFEYAILDDATGLPIETGLGYLDTGALVREVIEATIVSGTVDRTNPSAVSLAAGTKRVICTGTASSLLTSAPLAWTGATYKGYGDCHLMPSASTGVMVADQAYVIPFERAVAADIDAVLIRVMTAGASGKLAKAAVFAYAANGGPGAVLATSSSELVDSTGIKALTFSRFTPPARFFVGLVCDGTPTIQTYAGGTLATFSLGFSGTLTPHAFFTHPGATSLTFPTSWSLSGVTGTTARPQCVVRIP
jgi:hypothetical protein